MNLIHENVKEKYGRFFGEEFDTPEQFINEYMSSDLIIAYVWQEFNVTLVEVYDNNMWNEIIIINGLYDDKDFKLSKI